MTIPRQRHKFLKKDLLDQHTLTLKGDQLLVHTITCHTRVIKVPTDAWLRQRLEELNSWGRPWDNFDHVITQLRAGRTYMLRNGMDHWARFAD
jgi:hypothetical protein